MPWLDHPFADRINADFDPPTARALAILDGEPQDQGPPRDPEIDEYISDVFQRWYALADLILKVDRSLFFLEHLPEPGTYDVEDIDLEGWTSYHFESYLIAMAAIQDRVLLLVNTTLRLGLDPRDCRQEILDRHTVVKKSADLLEGLKAVSSYLKKVKIPEDRNRAVHRGEIVTDPQELVLWLKQHADGKTPEEFHEESQKVFAAKATILKPHVVAVTKLVRDILTALLPHYEAVVPQNG